MISNLNGVEMTISEVTYYFSLSGSDSNSGENASSPFKTLAYTLSKLTKFLKHDVTTNVAQGTYTEKLEATCRIKNCRTIFIKIECIKWPKRLFYICGGVIFHSVILYFATKIKSSKRILTNRFSTSHKSEL